ncbi:MAG: hypothetical protein ACREIT_08905 [Tepidisphaeraceae bacterium]
MSYVAHRRGGIVVLSSIIVLFVVLTTVSRAGAGTVTLISQERSVRVAAFSGGPDDGQLQEQAGAFGLFNQGAAIESAVPGDSGARASAAQTSVVDGSMFCLVDTLSAQSGFAAAEAESRFVVVFSLDAAMPYELTIGGTSAPVVLKKSDGTTVLDELGVASVGSGVLDAGQYTLSYASLLWTDPSLGGDEQSVTSSFELTLGAMAPVPLPPAAWMGLATLAGVGVVGHVRRKR